MSAATLSERGNRERGPFGLSPLASTIGVVTVTLDLPAEAQARLQAEAARRGITLDQLVAEIADSFPADPANSDGAVEAPRRRRSFVGIGSSTSGRNARDADEMLAEGFGRD